MYNISKIEIYPIGKSTEVDGKIKITINGEGKIFVFHAFKDLNKKWDIANFIFEEKSKLEIRDILPAETANGIVFYVIKNLNRKSKQCNNVDFRKSKINNNLEMDGDVIEVINRVGIRVNKNAHVFMGEGAILQLNGTNIAVEDGGEWLLEDNAHIISSEDKKIFRCEKCGKSIDHKELDLNSIFNDESDNKKTLSGLLARYIHRGCDGRVYMIVNDKNFS